MWPWVKRNKVLLLACFAIALIPFIPISRALFKLSKFQIITVSKESSLNNEFKYYCDFNYDGTSETVRLIPELYKNVSIIVKKKERIVGQWSFNGKLAVSVDFLHFDDYDFNNQKEIYLVYYRSDSLFINGFEPLSNKTIVDDYFITTFERYLGETDYSVSEIQLTDLNNDNFKDLIIVLMCGYSVTTRKIISLDIHNSILIESPQAGFQMVKNLLLFDINDDKEKEIFGTYAAFGNCPKISKSYPLTDTLAWLIFYNHNLKYLFYPFIVGKNPSRVTTVPLMTQGGGKIAWFYEYFGNGDDTSFIAISDLNGKLIKKQYVYFDVGQDQSFFTSFPRDNPNQLALYGSDGTIRIFNEEIRITGQSKKYPLINLFPIYMDLNQDGVNEYIFNDDLKYLVIISQDFKHTAKEDIISEPSERLISVIQDPGKDPLFFISTKQFDYTFKYQENPYYNFRYMLMAGSYLLIFGLFLSIGWMFHIIAQRRFEAERRISEIQITALEKHLNPHFNLNVLNSIGALYENKETEKARYYFGKYAKLLRNMLLLSGKIAIPLEEELEFVKTYLDLEKLRTDNSFDYQIKVSDNTPKIEIPKMLIHNFVENAVKHGIRHLTTKGEIKILIESSGKQVIISVSDNGVGKVKAREYSSMSTGQGIKILNETLELYSALKNIKIEYKITDLFKENGEPSGTKAEIIIPIS